MTQRRIIQAQLAKHAQSCFEQRNEWTVAASEVVPANNPELKALRSALVGLTPRIDEGRARIRDDVAKQLAEKRKNDWLAEETRLKDVVSKAEVAHRTLAQQAMAAMQTALNVDDSTIKALQARREEIAAQQEVISGLERDVAEHLARVARLKTATSVNMAGLATYQSLESPTIASFDTTRLNAGLSLGAGVTLLMMFVIYLISGPGRVPTTRTGDAS
ncbi:MAG: hypothetical protein IPK83_19215 [Planctomycetes bacterium]|nr:hypothetical protein [Planctomycetota bacterium]